MREVADGADTVTKMAPSAPSKSVSSSTVAQSVVNGSSESTGGTPLSSSSDLCELPEDQLSWEAFFGKMENRGDMLGLGREEQIVVKQQMLDRLMQLEHELQERTMMVSFLCVQLHNLFLRHISCSTVLGTNSQCIGIGKI